jgi:alkanesulfonate monooxygenase SsuD/methylene tetrahydromethanopterin reductase-like flavin-dependent oxidoreductase (luciferase family)
VENFIQSKIPILYTKPPSPIPIYIAGLGIQSAQLAGEEGNGFVTNELDINKIKDILFPAVKKGSINAGEDYEKTRKDIVYSCFI